MRLSDYLDPQSIYVIDNPESKEAIIRELVDRLSGKNPVLDPESIMAAVIDREKQCSTGIGGGFAIPHAIVDNLQQTVIVCAQVPSGMNFKTLDKKPVYFVYLLLSPESERREHIKLLARISRIGSQPGFIEKIKESDNPSKLYEILCEEDSRHV